MRMSTEQFCLRKGPIELLWFRIRGVPEVGNKIAWNLTYLYTESIHTLETGLRNNKGKYAVKLFVHCEFLKNTPYKRKKKKTLKNRLIAQTK